MENFSPYTLDELREMRRLLLAADLEILAWCARLRRSADYLQSLSPDQAGIVAEQAAAIAADPEDYGDEQALKATQARLNAIAEAERQKFVWREIVAVRRRYYPSLPDA